MDRSHKKKSSKTVRKAATDHTAARARHILAAGARPSTAGDDAVVK